jgi:signal peptidase I
MNRKVPSRSTDVTDPAAQAPDAVDTSAAVAAVPAPVAPDGIGDPARADRGGAERAGADSGDADRPAADPVGTGQVGAERAGLPPAGAERNARRPRRSLRRFALVLAALVVLALITVFVARIYVIPSGSMETTLHGCPGCDNDRVLVDKLAYRFGAPARGDIVVFPLPDTWNSPELQIPHGGGNPVVEAVGQLGSLVGLRAADETEYIKRVIAVGGQTVACCDDRNRITVDGVAVDEPYIYFLPEAGTPRQKPFGPVQVPEGQLWVMGDSRNDSVDSRAEGNGPVPVAEVIGRARFVLWPFDRAGGIS